MSSTLTLERVGGLNHVMGKDTNCGEKVHYNCTKCRIFGWNDPNCQTCIIYQLKKRIQELESENAFLKKDQDKQFDLDLNLFYKQGGKRYIETPYTQPKEQDNLYFLTITFDPNRFKNLSLNADAEETYILHQLALATKDQLIIELVGCFELQNNGTTHAHVHVRTYQPIELYKSLKKKFTNNMRNNKAIDLQPARSSEKGMEYINKKQDGKGTENKSWFTINSLRIVLDEVYNSNRKIPSSEGTCSEAGVCFSEERSDEINKLTIQPSTLESPKTVKKCLKKYSRNLISSI